MAYAVTLILALAAGAWWLYRVLTERRAYDAAEPPARFVSGALPATPGITVTRLQYTQVVPTLDAPLVEGSNAVWCGAFEAAWKQLGQANTTPVVVAGAENACAKLNSSADPTADLPPGQFYIKGGLASPVFLEEVRTNIKRQFGDLFTPDFQNIAPETPFAYACMSTAAKFAIPYFQSDEPLTFLPATLAPTSVRSFGLRSRDQYAYPNLRAQARVLACQPGATPHRPALFAIDLCQSSRPNQVIVARLPRDATLAAALEYLNQQMADYAQTNSGTVTLGPGDELLMPSMHFAISHEFTELTHHIVATGSRAGLTMIASQDILFRLDRGGDELSSESKTLVGPTPTQYIIDGPFLVVVKHRDTDRPFLAVWVENAELLQIF